MARPRSRLNVYILLAAVIIAAISAYYLPTKRPQNASMMSPREYIELVQRKRQEQQRQREEEDARRRATSPDGGEGR
ncbi:MAG TPA: hypothetical protein ENJ94_08720 [Gammaproteobacteria bacterium]|nr:hypothetical protein [Gammaproteobacteria bacterium]